MIFVRTSPVTGNLNEMDLPVTQAQIDLWKSGCPIQEALSNLSADQREFILTGMTPEDWDFTFSEKN